METTFIIIQGILCITWLYLYGEQNKQKKQINDLSEMQKNIILDVLYLLRKEAIENEDYRKLADIDRILNKK